MFATLFSMPFSLSEIFHNNKEFPSQNGLPTCSETWGGVPLGPSHFAGRRLSRSGGQTLGKLPASS